MAEKTYIKSISLNGVLYGLGMSADDLYTELGFSKERFTELLERDFYCPTLDAAPTSSLLTYTDPDGSEQAFQVGQPCRWQNALGAWRMAVCLNVTDTEIEWYVLPIGMSELRNDADLATNVSVDYRIADAKTELNETISALDEELSDTISSSNILLDDKMVSVQGELTASISSVDSRLTESINTVQSTLEASIASNKTETDAAIAAHEAAVDTQLNDMQVEFETLITEHRDYMYGKLDEMQATVDDSNATAAEAERVSYAAQTAATQASTDAAAAVAAVATLEGLADTTTAQETLAAQVAQIEANKQNILAVPNFELVRETGYDL